MNFSGFESKHVTDISRGHTAESIEKKSTKPPGAMILFTKY